MKNPHFQSKVSTKLFIGLTSDHCHEPIFKLHFMKMFLRKLQLKFLAATTKRLISKSLFTPALKTFTCPQELNFGLQFFLEFSAILFHLEVQPVSLLYTIFDSQRQPFVYPLVTNSTPSTCQFRTLHPFNCCKYTVYKYE